MALAFLFKLKISATAPIINIHTYIYTHGGTHMICAMEYHHTNILITYSF